MKTLFLALISTILFVFLTCQTFAQSYDFEYQTNQTYVPLTSDATIVANSDSIKKWYGEPQAFYGFRRSEIPIGFDFTTVVGSYNVLDITYSLGLELQHENESLITLISSCYTFAPVVGEILIEMFEDDAVVRYRVDENLGQKILKIEFANITLVRDPDYNANVYERIGEATWQVWLYEGSNHVDFHYSTHSNVQRDFFYGYWHAGIGSADFDAEDKIINSVSVFEPEIGQYDLTDGPGKRYVRDTTHVINDFPNDGTVFKFFYTGELYSDITEIMTSFNFYHNFEGFGLSSKNNSVFEVEMYDLNGQLIDQLQSEDGRLDYRFSANLSNGVYLLKVKDDLDIYSTKVVKQ